MNFSQLLSVLRARIWVAALVLMSVVVLAIGVSLLLPKKYLATASVLIDPRPDPVSAVLYGGGVSPALITTQVDVIQSERVALTVVRNLKLAENAQLREEWVAGTGGTGNFEVWLAQSLQTGLDVKPARESNVISVSYLARDPQFAAALANAFVQAFVQTSLELRVDPARRYTSFFDSRAKDAREALEQAQAKVSAFQREKGIIVADDRLDVETARLNELSSQLVAIQAVAGESSSRQAQAQGVSGDKLQEVLNNPVVGLLKSDLSRAEARLQELSARLGDNHPQVVEAKASINEMKARIDSETRRVTGGVGVTNTINRQREGQIKGELEAQRTKVLRLRAVRDEGAVLMRDVEQAQRAYDSVQARLNQSNLESQATQTNVYALTQAAPPSEHSSPRILLNSLAGVFLGTLLAAGVAIALELTDRRLRSAEDVAPALGLPLIGVMPKPGARRIGTRGQPMFLQNHLVSGLAAPGKGV